MHFLHAAERLQAGVELLEPLFDQIVVVVVPRVAGDPVAAGMPLGKRALAGASDHQGNPK